MSETVNQTSERVTHPWVAEGARCVRFGVGLVAPRPEPPRLLERVREIETLGFDSYWQGDHPGGSEDCWTALAAMAVSTKTIRLVSSVACVCYRSPFLLARDAADVDRLSDGRLVLGVGIGYAADEFAALGVPFPATRERQEALDEAMQIVQGAWGEAPFTFQGKHFSVREAHVNHGPVQRPRVPTMIAGGGEKVTLRQVAQYADMSNFGELREAGGAYTTDDVRRKLDVLRRYCKARGRPFDSVLTSHLTLPLLMAPTRAALQAKLDALPPDWVRWLREAKSLMAVTPDEARAYYASLVDAGIRYFGVGVRGDDMETVRLLAEHVVPAFG